MNNVEEENNLFFIDKRIKNIHKQFFLTEYNLRKILHNYLSIFVYIFEMFCGSIFT